MTGSRIIGERPIDKAINLSATDSLIERDVEPRGVLCLGLLCIATFDRILNHCRETNSPTVYKQWWLGGDVTPGDWVM